MEALQNKTIKKLQLYCIDQNSVIALIKQRIALTKQINNINKTSYLKS